MRQTLQIYARRARHFFQSDVHIAALLACVAAVSGMGYLLSPAGDRFPGFPPYFDSAAVSIACGEGFQIFENGGVPVLEPFMNREVQTFSCDDLPANPPLWDQEGFRESHRYYLYCVGAVWWLFGIGWQTLKLLLLAFFCVSAVLLYAVFRLGMNRPLSALGTLCWIFAPVVYTAVSLPRDFTKAPWIFAIILLLGLLIKHPWRPRALLSLSAVLGLCIGVGLGFRQDILAFLLPAVVVLLFFTTGLGGRVWPWRVAAVVVMLLSFYIPAKPILDGTAKAGSLASHNVINGMATEHDDLMGVQPSSYETIYCLNDNFSHAVRVSYVRRALDYQVPIYNEGDQAGWAGNRFLLKVFATFPADQFARMLSGARFVLGDVSEHTQVPARADEVQTRRIVKFYAPITEHMQHFGVSYAIAGIVLLAFINLRWACGVYFLLLFLATYPVLQFQLRHTFHLAFLPFWMAGLCLQCAWTGGKLLRQQVIRARIADKLRYPATLWNSRTRNALCFIAVALALIVLPLWMLRGYQYVTVSRLVAKHAAAQLTPLTVTQEDIAENAVDWALFHPTGLPQPVMENPSLWTWRPVTHYLVIELAGGDPNLPLWLHYDSETEATRFDRVVHPRHMDTDPGKITRYFFPTYTFVAENAFIGKSTFGGVGIPRDQADRLKGMYLVTNQEAFPLLLNLTLPEDRARMRFWQRTPLPW